MPLITINYSFGTEGKDIAQTVAQKLGVELFDDKKLRTFVTKSEVSTFTENRFLYSRSMGLTSNFLMSLK